MSIKEGGRGLAAPPGEAGARQAAAEAMRQDGGFQDVDPQFLEMRQRVAVAGGCAVTRHAPEGGEAVDMYMLQGCAIPFREGVDGGMASPEGYLYTMEELSIRRATTDDLDVLREICIRTFREAFGSVNRAEDMAQYLASAFSREKLLSELQDPGTGYHLAECGGEAVGYLMLNTGDAQSEPMGGGHLEIARIYVLAGRQGNGVGQTLMEEALRTARANGCSHVWLGVWEHNPAAIRFYERNGFEAFGRHAFLLGRDEQTDILMRRRVGT